MDEIASRLQTSHDIDIESRVESGWSALKNHDIGEARAVWRDVYECCPAHPSLPALAAGISRIRRRRVPRRPLALILAGVLVLIGGGFVLLSRGPRVTAARPAQVVQSTVPAPVSSSPPEVSSPEAATAGQFEAPPRSEPHRNVRETPPDEDTLIGAAITRFAAAYRSRWTPLEFEPCDLARQTDGTATAICRARAPGTAATADADDVWTFSLEKVGGAWKILSVEAPPDHM